ncbi:Fic family protein [Sagittula sp.]|uniref:Fic family protein n=1 Tax=Sagittula sp. TaxID=2038081 RepID=UPI0035147589
MKEWTLLEFLKESNRIEGLPGPKIREIEAAEALLALTRMTVEALQVYVSIIAPGKPLRDRHGLDVRVGDHIAPPGGPDVRAELDRLIFCANHSTMDAHTLHIEYEMLHPFMDGNGRSGRLLWLWMREGRAPIGFLHRFYYDTLSRAQR